MGVDIIVKFWINITECHRKWNVSMLTFMSLFIEKKISVKRVNIGPYCSHFNCSESLKKKKPFACVTYCFILSSTDRCPSPSYRLTNSAFVLLYFYFQHFWLGFATLNTLNNKQELHHDSFHFIYYFFFFL